MRDIFHTPSPSNSQEQEREVASGTGIGGCIRKGQSHKSLQTCKNDQAQSSPLIEEVGCASVCICVYL